MSDQHPIHREAEENTVVLGIIKEMINRHATILRTNHVSVEDHVYELQSELRLNAQGQPVLAIRVDVTRHDGTVWVGCTELKGNDMDGVFRGGVAFSRHSPDPLLTESFNLFFDKVKEGPGDLPR